MKFYKDKGETFSCDLEIEGASLSESQARLVLKFDNDRIYLFEGSISDTGVCEVKIPALKEISAKSGKVKLEVIAESTYFIPWESDFSVEASKKVGIKEVKFANQDKKELSEVKVKSTKPINQENKKAEKPSNQNQLIIEIKKGISEKSRDLVKTALQKFAKMSSKDKAIVLENIKNFVPSTTVKKWADRTFVTTNQNSKICTYLISQGITALDD